VILIFAAHGAAFSMRVPDKDRNQPHHRSNQLNKTPGLCGAEVRVNCPAWTPDAHPLE
jgi:hypothetical protein